jgi:hypothetical protein
MGGELFLLESDLLFSSRIESAASRAGLKVKIMVTVDQLQKALEESVPKALLVNLDALPGVDRSLAGLLQGRCKLIGYYSHADSKVASQALASGFEMIIPRRKFVDKLNEIFADISSS